MEPKGGKMGEKGGVKEKFSIWLFRGEKSEKGGSAAQRR